MSWQLRNRCQSFIAIVKTKYEATHHHLLERDRKWHAQRLYPRQSKIIRMSIILPSHISFHLKFPFHSFLNSCLTLPSCICPSFDDIHRTHLRFVVNKHHSPLRGHRGVYKYEYGSLASLGSQYSLAKKSYRYLGCHDFTTRCVL